jgi:hypothetical protein
MGEKTKKIDVAKTTPAVEANFFVLRTPLLPLQQFLALSDGLKAHCANSTGQLVS